MRWTIEVAVLLTLIMLSTMILPRSRHQPCLMIGDALVLGGDCRPLPVPPPRLVNP